MEFDVEKQRKQRNEVLKKVYSYYCDGEYLGHQISLNLKEKADKEAYTAYIYLKEKKYVNIYNHHSVDKFIVKITASGIEKAEELIKGKERDR